MNTQEIAAYLQRIAYDGDTTPRIATLQALHYQHALRIPFENLSPLQGQPVVLNKAALMEKLVHGKRGGYCLEHNRLLAEVLRALGFQVQALAARVLWNLPETTLLPRTHTLLLVEVEGELWLADAGFGGLSLTAPLKLEAGLVQQSPHERFRLLQDGQDFILQVALGRSGTDSDWKPMYRFDLQPQQAADLDMMNWYVSTHPESRFTSALIAARPDEACRHALLNGRYTRYQTNGRKEEHTLESVEELRALLKERFLLDVPKASMLDQRLQSLLHIQPGAD